MAQSIPASSSMDGISSTLPSLHPSSSIHTSRKSDSQHDNVYRKMESFLARMQHPEKGVPIKNVKTLLSKIPSVFTGSDLVSWMVKNMKEMEAHEAFHLAQAMTSHGYIFPINDHILQFKADNTYYRFQTPFFWPSMHSEPDDMDYAIHLCKRIQQNKQRLELADYEAENYSRLQKKFSRQWEFVSMQADTQAKLEKRRERNERQILESQEKAFWDVHRPAPGCVNTTEVDIKKTCRSLYTRSKLNYQCTYAVFGGTISPSPCELNIEDEADDLSAQIENLKVSLNRNRVKVSKVGESLQLYADQFKDHDLLISTAEATNPWVTDNSDLWEDNDSLKLVTQRRAQQWSLSIRELLKDPAGRNHFMLFLEKEFSAENLKFWEACQYLKILPLSKVEENAIKIYEEFIETGAKNAVNIDCRVLEGIKTKIESSINKHCFEEAEEQILHLMKNDSYSRYIRSDFYKDFILVAKKKPSKKRFTSDVRRFKELTTSKSQPIFES